MNKTLKRASALLLSCFLTVGISLSSYQEAKAVAPALPVVTYAIGEVIGTICLALGVGLVANQVVSLNQVSQSIYDEYLLTGTNSEIEDFKRSISSAMETGRLKVGSWINSFRDYVNTRVGFDPLVKVFRPSGEYVSWYYESLLIYSSAVPDSIRFNQVVFRPSEGSRSCVFYDSDSSSTDVMLYTSFPAVSLEYYNYGSFVWRSKMESSLNSRNVYVFFVSTQFASSISRNKWGYGTALPVFTTREEAEAYTKSGIGVDTGDHTIPDNPYQVIAIGGAYETIKDHANIAIVGDGAVINDKTGEVAGDTTIAVAPETVIDKVVTGDIAWGDAMADIGANVVDIPREEVNDKVISTDRDIVTDKELGEKLPTVSGDVFDFLLDSEITQLFPFCIPFDLVRLVKVFQAPPETPHFELPMHIKVFSLDYTYTFVIDLSPFDGVAQIMRTGFLLLFIMGLILSTRSLIRG